MAGVWTSAKFLLLAGASRALLRQTRESLLGRVAVIEVGGFGLDQLDASRLITLRSRGGAPLNNKAKLTAGKAYGFRTLKAAERARYAVLGELPAPQFLLTNQ